MPSSWLVEFMGPVLPWRVWRAMEPSMLSSAVRASPKQHVRSFGGGGRGGMPQAKPPRIAAPSLAILNHGRVVPVPLSADDEAVCECQVLVPGVVHELRSGQEVPAPAPAPSKRAWASPRACHRATQVAQRATCPGTSSVGGGADLDASPRNQQCMFPLQKCGLGTASAAPRRLARPPSVRMTQA